MLEPYSYRLCPAPPHPTQFLQALPEPTVPHGGLGTSLGTPDDSDPTAPGCCSGQPGNGVTKSP